MKRRPRSIVEFAHDQKRKGCPVCEVPLVIRQQIVSARAKRITVPVVLEWLKSEHGIRLTRGQIRLHYGGMHDGKVAR